jgi:hypothetical protein
MRDTRVASSLAAASVPLLSVRGSVRSRAGRSTSGSFSSIGGSIGGRIGGRISGSWVGIARRLLLFCFVLLLWAHRVLLPVCLLPFPCAEAGLIAFVPDDSAVLVAVQALSGAAAGAAVIVLLATSYLFSLLQGDN